MDKAMMAGLASAGKAALTGLPAAVATDVLMGAYAPPSMTPNTRHVVRAAVGAGITLAALMAGAPSDYAAGPLVANTAIVGVEASRSAGWAQRLREQMERARTAAGQN